MLKGWPWLALGAPCNLHGFLFTLLHPVALWTVCGLNCDRYYAITSPLRYGSVVNPKKVAIGLAFTWLVSLVLCIPPLFLVAPYRFNPGIGGCAPDFAEEEGTIWYSLTYTTFTLLLPAILILGCNLRVLMIARYHRHRIASAIFEVTISAQVTITHQRNPFLLPSGNVFRGRSAISTVLQLIGSFLILYLPYYGVILWESSSSLFIGEWKASSTRFHTLLVTLASTLLNCSPPVNGLLYGVKSKMLRKSFQNYWRKQMSKNEMNQEIQARTPSTCGSRRPSLTPLGFLARPASSHFQRRSSEVYLERQSNSSRCSIQRIASELSWRPQSTTGINLDSTEPLRKSKSFRDTAIPKHSSCNILQVPKERDNVVQCDFPSYKIFKVAISKKLSSSQENTCQTTKTPCNTNAFFQKMFGGSYRVGEPDAEKKIGAVQTLFASPARRSPRILITRAFSEESDQQPSKTDSPVRLEMNRSHSSSTTALVEKKWKKLRYQDEENDKFFNAGNQDIKSQEPAGNNSSTSTSEEENDGGGLYMSFGTGCESPEGIRSLGDISGPIDQGHQNCISRDQKRTQVNGPVYLFSWPIRRKSGVSCGSSTVMLTRSVANLSGVSEFQL
ncbi:UNVERIFIED_CONTAM: hypothetical protein PYX00_005194 [Menopon gallinae]|uniref:G-protein coupled receptors family 1 profile domain-containing protein n=1 Tax=Menopon gallinae TaxID=328185 RepID=A0AAW2HRK0_9NEOP